MRGITRGWRDSAPREPDGVSFVLLCETRRISFTRFAAWIPSLEEAARGHRIVNSQRVALQGEALRETARRAAKRARRRSSLLGHSGRNQAIFPKPQFLFERNPVLVRNPHHVTHTRLDRNHFPQRAFGRGQIEVLVVCSLIDDK